MSSFLTQVKSANGGLLWLDDSDYASQLLAGGAAPWLDPAAYVAWRRKAHSLLKSAVTALPVARVAAALIAADASLHGAMAAKSRLNHPLKTLLSCGELRRHVDEMLTGLRSSFPAHTLALVCPSPRAWLQDAYRSAFDAADTQDVGEDAVDSATLHCADFLRAFAACGLDTVLLEENLDSEPTDGTELEWYRSVLNVGAHYRWEMGLRIPGRRFSGDAAAFAYVISPVPVSASCVGCALPESVWSGAPIERQPADFNFAHIPPGASPELVLDRLTVLRAP